MRATALAALGLGALAALGLGALAVGDEGNGNRPTLPHGGLSTGLEAEVESRLLALLSGVDHVPSRAELDALLGDDAAEVLLALCQATATDVDAGVRVRAYRAMGHYPGEATAIALGLAVQAHAEADDGVDILYLRAAMISFATVAGGDAVPTLRPVLEHPSKDARAAAADALAVTGSPDAVKWLHERLDDETDEMVRLHINAALRALGDPD